MHRELVFNGSRGLSTARGCLSLSAFAACAGRLAAGAGRGRLALADRIAAPQKPRDLVERPLRG